MAEKTWVGGAVNVAQVDTLTVGGTIEVGDKFIITINLKSLVVVAASTTVDTVRTAITTAFNASTIPEFKEITAADSTAGLLTLTGDTAGKPFTATVLTTETDDGAADAQTFTTSATTAATGENHADNVDNYSDGLALSNGDDLVLNSAAVSDILYALDQSAVTLASLTITNGFIKKVGLPRINKDTSRSEYPEYREQSLKINATLMDITGAGSGSGRIKIDLGSAQTTTNISANGTPAETNIPAVLLKGTHVSNIFRVSKGQVGLAFFDEESLVAATLSVGFETNMQRDSIVFCGDGCTLTDVDLSGGELIIDSNTATIDQTGGTLTALSGTHTDVDVDGGKFDMRSGTVTTGRVGGGGHFDCSQGQQPRTITNALLMSKGSEFSDPQSVVTTSAGITLNRARISDVKIDVGVNRTLTVS